MAKKLTDSEIEQKQLLIAQTKNLYEKVSRYCSGRPPLRACSGSYQEAIDFKNLVVKTKRMSGSARGSIDQIQAKINRLTERLQEFKKFE